MSAEHVPPVAAVLCYIQFYVLIAFGRLRELFGRFFGSRYKSPLKRGYAPLLASFESFYTNRIYHRFQAAFNRPVAGAPGTSRSLPSINE